MESTMFQKGGSNYKIFHIGKEQLQPTGQLQRNVFCLKETIEKFRSDII